jgi:PAS domain-containing protein
VTVQLPVLARLIQAAEHADEVAVLIDSQRAWDDANRRWAAVAGVRQELERRAAAFAARCHDRDRRREEEAQRRDAYLTARDRYERDRQARLFPHGTPAAVRRHERAGHPLCDLCLPVRRLMAQEGYTAAALASR